MNTEKAIEMLHSAEFNCDNLLRMVAGTPVNAFVCIVKAQIQDALRELGAEVYTTDPLAGYRP